MADDEIYLKCIQLAGTFLLYKMADNWNRVSSTAPAHEGGDLEGGGGGWEMGENFRRNTEKTFLTSAKTNEKEISFEETAHVIAP